jgi:hypothetical protein
VVDANQAGSGDYEAAPQRQQSVKVAATAASIATLTLRDLHGSAKYKAATAKRKRLIGARVKRAIKKLRQIGAHRTAAANGVRLRAYERAIAALEASGWLMAQQAQTLTAAASALEQRLTEPRKVVASDERS